MARAFAGPLCRYFAGERGEAIAHVAGVEAWRGDLNAALGKNLAAPLHWREDPRDRGSWCDLGDSGWLALRLFALLAERSDLDLPDTVPALLELDPEWRAAQQQKFATSRYGQLLACRCWLPADFPFTARVPLPDGEFAELGSLPILREQLRWLNQRTFQADAGQLTAWLGQPAPTGGALLPAAQRGFAGLWRAVEQALPADAPVVVDELGHGR